MAVEPQGHIPYRGILMLILPIVVAMGYMIYMLRDVPTKAIEDNERIIDSLEHRIVPLDTIRDTIKAEIIKTQIKWRERLVEAYEEPETIWVEAYVPMMLDSCQEVGRLLAIQVGIHDSMIQLYRGKDSLYVKAIATRDSLDAVCREEWARERKIGRIYKLGAIIGGALLTGGLIAK